MHILHLYAVTSCSVSYQPKLRINYALNGSLKPTITIPTNKERTNAMPTSVIMSTMYSPYCVRALADANASRKRCSDSPRYAPITSDALSVTSEAPASVAIA